MTRLMTRLALKVKEAAEAVGVSEDMIRKAYSSGHLTVHYVGNSPRIRVEDLDEWMRSLPTDRVAS